MIKPEKSPKNFRGRCGGYGSADRGALDMPDLT